jgi:valyl-tRNA synthetase
MSSTQDVRYSADRVRQGRDLANKMWNASRLILLNAGDAEPGPRTATIEDRWILSRLQRAIDAVGDGIEAYDFAHAALGFYSFFWSELCDWYLEIVKPRLYEGDGDAAANLLHVLERVLALAHPFMPFVSEEIWGYLPGERGLLAVSPFPAADRSRIDPQAEEELDGMIGLVRRVRRWRDLVGVAPGRVLAARATDDRPADLVARLARLGFDSAEGEPLATFGPIEILPSEGIDAEHASARIAERREALEAEVERAERKLANPGFVAKAPAEVVDAERAKLGRYREELGELG